MKLLCSLPGASWFRRKTDRTARRPNPRRLRIESLENRRNLSGGMLDVSFDGDGVVNTLVGTGSHTLTLSQ